MAGWFPLHLTTARQTDPKDFWVSLEEEKIFSLWQQKVLLFGDWMSHLSSCCSHGAVADFILSLLLC